MLVKLDHLPRNPGENKKLLKSRVRSIAPCWCCDSKAKYCFTCPRSTKWDGIQINQISHLDYLVCSSNRKWLGKCLFLKASFRSCRLNVIFIQSISGNFSPWDFLDCEFGYVVDPNPLQS